MVRRTRPQMCNCTSEVSANARPGMTAGESPIAVKMIVPIVIAAAAIATIPDPEHAFDRSHRAADTGTDCAANHTTDGAGNPVTLAGAFLRAAHDALRMPELGNREQRENECRSRKEFYRHSGRQARCHGPGLHVNSLVLGRDWPTGGNV